MSMAAVTPALVGANKSAFKGTRVSAVAPKKVAGGRATLQVRTPAMRPRPHRARATDAARATAKALSDGTDETRASPASSRRLRTRGGTGSRDVSKREPFAPIQGPRRVRERICPDRPAREPGRPRDSVGTPRHAPRSSRRAPRASYARPRARDPAHVRARRALPARLDRLRPLAAVWSARCTRTRRAEPCSESSQPAKKRKNVSSLFEHRGFFFVKRRKSLEPAPKPV